MGATLTMPSIDMGRLDRALSFLPTWAWRDIALIVPVILVNVAAFTGQLTWATLHLGVPTWTVWVFAGALESIGVFLAFEAHQALMAGDAALRLRLASYAVAGLVGVLNYNVHAGPDWAPTPAALAFGAMSTISPWLWSIRSRSMHRAELRAAGLIDARAVRFSMVRWVLYPRWTWQVWRSAVWAGEANPEAAVSQFQPLTRAAKRATMPAPDPEPDADDQGTVTSTVVEQAPPPRSPRRTHRAKGNGYTAADVAAVADAIRAGQAPSLRGLKRQYRLGEPNARALIAAATAEAGDR